MKKARRYRTLIGQMRLISTDFFRITNVSICTSIIAALILPNLAGFLPNLRGLAAIIFSTPQYFEQKDKSEKW